MKAPAIERCGEPGKYHRCGNCRESGCTLCFCQRYGFLQAQLEAAKENGIPVVAFDSGVTDSKMVRAFRGTDNTRVGEIAAYRLATAIGKMGKVAVFSAQEKTQSIQERVSGFTNYITNYPDIEVVEIVYQDQVDDMTAAMQEVLDKYPQLDGVFCDNADIADLYLDMKRMRQRIPL
ncbi:MAG: substrate-binding domain-containing protein [Ruminococcus sp.]